MSGQPGQRTRAKPVLATDLARARGLGSAKEGTGHWWAQRLTSIALVPLIFWFAASLAMLAGAPHAEVISWLRNPVVAILTVALAAVGFHHLQLGLQVVIEDYVHSEGVRLGLIVAVKFVAVIAALIAIFSVLRIAFGG